MDVTLIWSGALYLAHVQSITHAAPALTICDPPRENQAYCTEKFFWVKATITNYNLWTIAPANLKSREQKYTRIACTIVLQKNAMNIGMYVARGSPYIRRLCKIRGHAHQVNELAGCQNVGESGRRRFNGKQRRDKRV